jgi:nicotinamidase/pyrazinamidase
LYMGIGLGVVAESESVILSSLQTHARTNSTKNFACHSHKVNMKTALIIVDPQIDFCSPAGSLYVPFGEDVIREINKLRLECDKAKVEHCFISRDSHPLNHVSFVDSHPGSKLYEEIVFANGTKQVMWPRHCVQGSVGAEISPDLNTYNSDIIIDKGTQSHIDSYSAFGSEDGTEKTPLLEHLIKANITHLIVVGLAFDYCVSYTAKDAAKHGFKVLVIGSATASTSEEGYVREKKEMESLGVRIIENIKSYIQGNIYDMWTR